MKEKNTGAVIHDFVDLSLVDSYDADYIILDHIRGTGKSYAAFNRAVKRFVDRGEGFVLIRRTRLEIDSLREYPWPSGLEAAWSEKGVILSNRGNKLFIDGKFAGIMRYLSGSGAKASKSTALPLKVSTFIFDEFQIETGLGGKYQQREPERLDSIVSSYGRYDDFKVIMCGNSDSFYNPYYIDWGVEPKLDGGIRYYKDKGVVLWHCISFPEAGDIGMSKLYDNNKSGLYKDMEETSIWNQRNDDVPLARVEIENHTYGLYVTIKGGFVWRPKGEGPIYAVEPHDDIPNVILAPWFKGFQQARSLGRRYFSDVKTKNYFEENIKYL